MAIVVLSGCSSAVDGSALPQHPAALQQVLPTAKQVEFAAGNPLDATGEPVLGSIEMLPNGIRGDDAVDPIECLGVIAPLMRWVYEKGDVHAVAWQDFARFGQRQTVSSVNTGVVRFASDAEAARMFSVFVTRWRSCEGGRVSINTGGTADTGGADTGGADTGGADTGGADTGRADLGLLVTDVAVDGPILSATILSGEGGTDAGFPTEHAVGLSADCIVDVDVAVTAPDPTLRFATNRAQDLARAMLANLNESQ